MREILFFYMDGISGDTGHARGTTWYTSWGEGLTPFSTRRQNITQNPNLKYTHKEHVYVIQHQNFSTLFQ